MLVSWETFVVAFVRPGHGSVAREGAHGPRNRPRIAGPSFGPDPITSMPGSASEPNYFQAFRRRAG
jgi:hypothetical protein